MIAIVNQILYLVVRAPIAVCLLGLLLHAAGRSRIARRADLLALVLSFVALTSAWGSVDLIRAFGASPVQIRAQAGWFLIAILFTLPALFLSGAAFIISAPSQQRPGGLGEPLRGQWPWER